MPFQILPSLLHPQPPCHDISHKPSPPIPPCAHSSTAKSYQRPGYTFEDGGPQWSNKHPLRHPLVTYWTATSLVLAYRLTPMLLFPLFPLYLHQQLHCTPWLITSSIVHKYIARLPLNKSPGADRITNEILRKLSYSIARPLSILFNLSLSSGTFPSRWKSATVIPVYKNKGDKNNPSNYRPISLLSCVSKLLESIVYDRLYDHISPLLHPAQSGFRRKDNTSLQLSRIIQDLCSLKDQRQVSCICFFDLSKAFDTVWHKGLIAKLRAHGVPGSLLAWITSYLLDRNQCVTVNGTLSDPESVTSGVPQGSILGPLLFLTYVNDLPYSIPNISLFADDTTVLASSPSHATLYPKVQTCINDIVHWMSTWYLKPNVTKTELSCFPLPQIQCPSSTFPMIPVTLSL